MDSEKKQGQEIDNSSLGTLFSKYPLTTSSPPEDWSPERITEARQLFGHLMKETQKLRAKTPLSGRDALVLMLYEADGSKIEKAFKWPSLSLWLRAWEEADRPATAAIGPKLASKQKLVEVLGSLLGSGADMESFQAFDPEAASAILDNPKNEEDADSAILCMEKLAAHGWKASFPDTSQDSGAPQGFRMFTARYQDAYSEKNPAASVRHERIAAAAKAAGLDFDSRTFKGESILGTVCASSTSLAKGRALALVGAGAAPSTAAPFWLAELSKAGKEAYEAGAAELAKRQLEQASNAPSKRPAGPRVL